MSAINKLTYGPPSPIKKQMYVGGGGGGALGGKREGGGGGGGGGERGGNREVGVHCGWGLGCFANCLRQTW